MWVLTSRCIPVRIQELEPGVRSVHELIVEMWEPTRHRFNHHDLSRHDNIATTYALAATTRSEDVPVDKVASALGSPSTLARPRILRVSLACRFASGHCLRPRLHVACARKSSRPVFKFSSKEEQTTSMSKYLLDLSILLLNSRQPDAFATMFPSTRMSNIYLIFRFCCLILIGTPSMSNIHFLFQFCCLIFIGQMHSPRCFVHDCTRKVGAKCRQRMAGVLAVQVPFLGPNIREPGVLYERFIHSRRDDDMGVPARTISNRNWHTQVGKHSTIFRQVME
ncbi:hypothetical protein B0H12DRAFT_136446 [Mycena haematopus]|nr:hypothetical protein B0H12DRAFT_136446 [Mycena haematopus]